MIKKRYAFLFLLSINSLLYSQEKKATNYVTHQVNLKEQRLHFYWKDDKGEVIGNFEHLKKLVCIIKEKH